MKKFGFLVPVVIFLLFSVVGTRLFASGTVNPSTLVIVMVIVLIVLLMARPKNAAPKPLSDVEQKVRGDYAKDAFSDDPKKAANFQSALKDYSGNMPKSALSKLQKLAPECSTDTERYAVAMATALCYSSVQKYKDALRQYTTAIVLHPTSELALTLGSCHQRLGELDKAQDSYTFALELDENNLEARSALATSYVADGNYNAGLHHAMLVLEKDEKHASSLATAAICHGLLGDNLLHKHYTKLAVENGYKEDKITSTVAALKKRDK